MSRPPASGPAASAGAGCIRIGIGGWTFPPWRGVFYPPGLPHSKELAYASAHLTSIEINATFYRVPPPATFRKWAKETPDGFVFSVKAPRIATNGRVLAAAGDAIARFVGSGLVELGDRLGPILWQLAPAKQFDAADVGAFLELLPRLVDGVRLRHAIEVRHPSFCVPEFIDLLRAASIPVVLAEHQKYPAIADLTGDFVYARLQQGDDAVETAYPPAALETWARRCGAWALGGDPDDLPHVDATRAAPVRPRDVFVYFIHAGKLRAPAAATALIGRLGNHARAKSQAALERSSHAP